jgi:hypothetical protein
VAHARKALAEPVAHNFNTFVNATRRSFAAKELKEYGRTADFLG